MIFFGLKCRVVVNSEWCFSGKICISVRTANSGVSSPVPGNLRPPVALQRGLWFLSNESKFLWRPSV